MGKVYIRYLQSAAVVILFVLGLIVTASTVQAASKSSKPRVIDINSNVIGNTYGEWSARWWQWALSIPADTNPILDETGANCAEGQTGDVWFLAGTFGDSPVVRNCTVPSMMYLFFPILNTVFGATTSDCQPTNPDVLCNVNTLRASAEASENNPKQLIVTVDGVQPKKLGDPISQRVTSPVFSINLSEDNIIGAPSGGYTPNVSDGYWIMLAPLSTGTHTIHFKGVTNSDFVVDVTYNLTVSP